VNALADIPGDRKEDMASILDSYGDLDNNALLKTVYERYPVYAKERGTKSESED
jgi:hypothetical protein